MSNIQDNICKLRDLFCDKKNYQKILFKQKLMDEVFNAIPKQMKNKATDYNYTLDFTAQDLRELAEEIKAFLKSVDNHLNTDKNIKKIWKISELDKGKKAINMDDYMHEVLPVMDFRREAFPKIYSLLSITEYCAVYLYVLEIAAKDKFAIKCTERIIRDKNGTLI